MSELTDGAQENAQEMPTVGFFFFFWYWGLNPGAFYLQATPPALFFILYFETGSH